MNDSLRPYAATEASLSLESSSSPSNTAAVPVSGTDPLIEERSAPLPTQRSLDDAESESESISLDPPASERGAPLDVGDDPETLDMVRDAIRRLAAGVVVMYLGYTAYNLTRLDAPGVRYVLFLDQVALAVSLVVYWVSRTKRSRGCGIHLSIGALALTVAANTSLSVLRYGEGSELQYMFAIAIGSGAIVVSARWLAFMLTATNIIALPAAIAVHGGGHLVEYAVIQCGACILAVVIFIGRMNTQRKLLRFRLRDGRRAHELNEALKRAEREFLEHQASERQKLQLLNQLRQTQKLEALGTLAGGVAHDINNVIGAITAIASSTIPDLPVGTPGRQELQQILVAARRGTTLTRNLVRFARQDQPKDSLFGLDAVVLDVQALLHRTLGKHIDLRTDCRCQGFAVKGDAGLISHALMNLCLNAAEAISERGTITISTRALDLGAEESGKLELEPGTYVELTVTDDGHGMTPEVLDRVFEPFYSTKEGKRQSGLGLPMVYGTVQQHHGSLAIESQPSRGTTVRVMLPAVHGQEVDDPVRAPKIPRVDERRPIAMFVDDEPLLRRAGRRILGSLGYEVLLASNGRDALERYQEQRARIGVVILDVAMPVMSGAECFLELRRMDPDLPVILASGFPKGHDLRPLLAYPKTRYVRKPYELSDVAETLAELNESTSVPPRPPFQEHA